MSDDPKDSCLRDPDLLEPAAVVEDMASAIERVRRMATTVFQGDAALFAEESHTRST
jgi:hypothetical protein